MRIISHEELYRATRDDKELLVISVSHPERFNAEHIAGTINIPVDDETFIHKLKEKAQSHDRVIVVYDESPESGLAELAAETLEGAGFKEVSVYLDGLTRWREEGYPVGSGPVSP